MTPHHYGADVAQKIHAFEDAIDAAIAAGADLTATAVTGRMEHKLSALTGAAGLEAIFASQAALAEARGSIVKAHSDLTIVARRERLNWLAHMGGPIHKPEGVMPEAAVTPLRIAS